MIVLWHSLVPWACLCLAGTANGSPTYVTSKYKKLLISKRRIGILKKLPKQGEDSESL